MAVTVTPATRFPYRKHIGMIDFENDTIKAALMGENFTFNRNKHKVWTAPTWSGEVVYDLGDTVKPTDPNDFIYLISAAGTSASTEPSWPVTFGNKVTDNNGVEYTCWSYNTVSGEISISGEYSQQTLALSGEGVVEDEEGNQSQVFYKDIVFEASGESFDPIVACVLYSETDPQKTIIAAAEFDTSYTVTAGNKLTITDPIIEDEAVQTST